VGKKLSPTVLVIKKGFAKSKANKLNSADKTNTPCS